MKKRVPKNRETDSRWALHVEKALFLSFSELFFRIVKRTCV
jgi:hypothetical protein